MLHMIAAVDKARGIGKDNQLLCHLSYTGTAHGKEDGDPEGARTLDLQRDRLAF